MTTSDGSYSGAGIKETLANFVLLIVTYIIHVT